MYESYWQLTAKPFENTSDTEFYYPGESHQGALLKLRYAVENRRSAVLLAGAAGLGKTLLVHALTRQLSDQYRPVAHLVFPQMPPDQLLAYLADELTGERTGSTPTIDQSVRRLEQVLFENAQAGRHAVLIIDEAHLLQDAETLETIRLLLNFEFDARPAFTLLLAGHPGLVTTVERIPEFDERISVKCLLRRLSEEETSGYIAHRVHAAGASTTIFDDPALTAIHRICQGVPRRINRLCDLCLLIGYAEERASIGVAQVESVAEELVAVAPE